MSGPHVDRISNLPHNILDNILMYLPLRDAVRTSILSRAWRYQWLTMPHIVFDDNFRHSFNGSYDLETILYYTLARHKGTITKFFVKDSWRVDRWLLFLSGQHLEDLTLLGEPCPYLTKMPLRLFDFKQLKHLCLEGFEIPDLPPTFQGFTRLVKLELLDVPNEGGILEKFLSKCPMLEYLNLKLHPSYDDMEEIPQGFDHSFDHLTVLNLERINFKCPDDVNYVLSFIKSSPNLQNLKILCDCYARDHVLSYLSAQRKADVPVSRLKTFEISGMSCSDDELEFIKTLLPQAKALQKLKLESCWGGNVLKSLASFDKVVSHAKGVTFNRCGRSEEAVILW